MPNDFLVEQSIEAEDLSGIIEVAYESRRWEQSQSSTSETFVYFICEEVDLEEADIDYGTFFTPNDDVGLAKFVYNNFPSTRDFVSSTFDITLFITSVSAEEKSEGWYVTLNYGIPDGQQAQSLGYVQLSFNTGGENINIKRANSIISSDVRTGVTTLPPETYGLIGATKDGVEGVDISDRGFGFSITAYFTPLLWQTSLALTFGSLTKTYNDDLFYGFAAGEVLLDNVDAQGEAMKLVPVTFNFIRKPNISDVADAPFPNLTMLGHDIVDYGYEKAASQDKQVIWPSFRQVLRVREPGDFDLLGI